MFLQKFKYITRNGRLFIVNAANNFKLQLQNNSLIINPSFKMINCEFEGNNTFFGEGKASNSSFGLCTYVQDRANIAYAKIGRFCSIGPNVIIAQGEHPYRFMSTSPIFYDPYCESYISKIKKFTTEEIYIAHAEVIIGSDVWIGANCFIKDGLKIGHGAVLAAGSVVTKDVPNYAIVGGVPAKVLKYRFEQDIIDKLLNLKWWEWDLDKLYSQRKMFQTNLKSDLFNRSF